MRLREPKLAVPILLLALVAGACRGSGGDNNVSTRTTANGEKEVATDVGVTSEPCPNAANKDHGCIYLGIISDLTKGPFAPLAVPITDAQKAFWAKVNKDGGIGDYDVDVTTYIRDNEYTPAVHKAKYDEIKGKVLGLGQTTSPATTATTPPPGPGSPPSAPSSPSPMSRPPPARRTRPRPSAASSRPNPTWCT